MCSVFVLVYISDAGFVFSGYYGEHAGGWVIIIDIIITVDKSLNPELILVKFS